MSVARTPPLPGAPGRPLRSWTAARRRWRAGAWLLAGVLAPLVFPARAPADTVAEQRARLPSPATCTDPVEGIWKAHDFDDRWYEWTEFTLEIRRVAGSADELEGFIYNHSWFGDKDKPQPGPCDGRLRFKVSMDAKGTYRDGRVSFHGVGQWRLDEVLCGQANFWYNLDHFTGTVDPAIQEFQSVNNDGGRAVNDPYVFRRIECFDEARPVDDAPRIAVTPPSFYPPEDDRQGCGLWR